MADQQQAAQQVAIVPSGEQAIGPALTTQDVKAKKPAPKRKTAKKSGSTVAKSKRKESVARAYLRNGSGIIRVNGRDIGALEGTGRTRNIMLESLALSRTAKAIASKVDIKINVRGGGAMSQAQAVRGAIAKGLVAHSGSAALKAELIAYDRSILVDDPRRVEPKKFKGPKARARFQTSYR